VEEDWQMTNLPAILRPETGELKLPAKPPWVLGIDLALPIPRWRKSPGIPTRGWWPRPGAWQCSRRPWRGDHAAEKAQMVHEVCNPHSHAENASGAPWAIPL